MGGSWYVYNFECPDQRRVGDLLAWFESEHPVEIPDGGYRTDGALKIPGGESRDADYAWIGNYCYVTCRAQNERLVGETAEFWDRLVVAKMDAASETCVEAALVERDANGDPEFFGAYQGMEGWAGNAMECMFAEQHRFRFRTYAAESPTDQRTPHPYAFDTIFQRFDDPETVLAEIRAETDLTIGAETLQLFRTDPATHDHYPSPLDPVGSSDPGPPPGGGGTGESGTATADPSRAGDGPTADPAIPVDPDRIDVTDPAIGDAIARAVSQGDERVLRALTDATVGEDADEAARRQLAEAMVDGDETKRSRVIEALAEADARAQRRLVETLANTADETVRDRIAAAAGEAGGAMRDGVAGAIDGADGIARERLAGAMDDEGLRDRVVEATSDADEDVRRRIVEALASAPDETARRQAVEAMGEGDEDVNRQIADALGDADESVRQRVADALSDADESVRRRIVRATPQRSRRAAAASGGDRTTDGGSTWGLGAVGDRGPDSIPFLGAGRKRGGGSRFRRSSTSVASGGSVRGAAPDGQGRGTGGSRSSPGDGSAGGSIRDAATAAPVQAGKSVAGAVPDGTGGSSAPGQGSAGGSVRGAPDDGGSDDEDESNWLGQVIELFQWRFVRSLPGRLLGRIRVTLRDVLRALFG